MQQRGSQVASTSGMDSSRTESSVGTESGLIAVSLRDANRDGHPPQAQFLGFPCDVSKVFFISLSSQNVSVFTCLVEIFQLTQHCF